MYVAGFRVYDRAKSMAFSIARSSIRLKLSQFLATPVHCALAICAAILVVFCVAAGQEQTLSPFLKALGIGMLLVAPALAVPALLHERGDIARRDGSLMIAWAIVVIVLFKQCILIATARAFPLCDQLFRQWDEHLGIRVPAVVHWAAQNPAGRLASLSYVWLEPMIICGVLLPIIFAKPVSVQRFVLANAIAIVLSLPFILLLPAIGPWVAWGFAPDAAQHAWDVGFRAVRDGTATEANMIASVCLPSLHVFWAMTSAQALWFLRWLRIPIVLVTTLIVCSTLTTGWHYGVDVLAGFVLAILCMAVAHVVARNYRVLGVRMEPHGVPAKDCEEASVPETVS